MAPLPPEVTASLARGMAAAIVKTVSDVGGNVPDVMTVLTAVVAHVVCVAMPEPRDKQTVEKLSELALELLPILREDDREKGEVRR